MSKPRRYPRNVAPLLDYDYLARLPPEAAAWLDRFTEEYYGGSFGDSPRHTDLADRREIQRVKRSRLSDIYAHGTTSRQAGEVRDLGADGEDPIRAQDPARDPEYREAVSAFRASLPDDGRRSVRPNHEFLKAAAHLDAVAAVTTDRQVRIPRVKGGLLPGDEDLKPERVQKGVNNHRIVTNLGILLMRGNFPGAEAQAVTEGLRYLSELEERLRTKLTAWGVRFAPLNGNGPMVPVPEAPAAPPVPADEAKTQPAGVGSAPEAR